MSRDLKAVSKQLSWILRHEALRLGLEMDPEGYVRLADLLQFMRRDDPDVTEEDIHKVIAEVETRKQRFSIVGDAIRANYGHSLEMRIGHEAAVPPDVLYHGTALKVREVI